jgi:acetyl esterase/lipase
MGTRVRGVLLSALTVVVGLSGGCGSAPATSLPHLAGTQDYLPGRAADVFLPEGATRAPVVVLIPGGGWASADPSGLRPLADELAAHGMVAITATYRAADVGARFPQPVADVVCAADFAAARSRAAGIEPGPVVLLGHSAGAHLAALAALAPDRFRTGCPYPPADADGLVGLAGPYDVLAVPALAEPLFGVPLAGHRTLWRGGDPLTLVGNRPRLPVLLAHGAEDDLVPPSLTTAFADRLRGAGHRVRVEMVPGADHGSIYRPAVIAPLLTGWLGSLDGRQG